MSETGSGGEFLTKKSGEPYLQEELVAMVAEANERFKNPDPNNPEDKRYIDALQSGVDAQRHAPANEGRSIILGRCGLALTTAKEKISDFLTPVADTSFDQAPAYGFVTGPSDSTELALEIVEDFQRKAA